MYPSSWKGDAAKKGMTDASSVLFEGSQAPIARR